MTPLAIVKSLRSQRHAINNLTIASIAMGHALNKFLDNLVQCPSEEGIQAAAKNYEAALAAIGQALEEFEKASKPMREMGEHDE